MEKSSYFKKVEDGPASLRFKVTQRVRFSECDSLGIVWHGVYTDYFEDARVASGNHYRIGYMDFYHRNVLVPLKRMHHDYVRPMKFNDVFSTEAILHWSEAARLNYEFIVRNESEQIVATGYSVQLMLDKDFNTLFVVPDFYNEFRERWRIGEIS